MIKKRSDQKEIISKTAVFYTLLENTGYLFIVQLHFIIIMLFKGVSFAVPNKGNKKNSMRLIK